MDKKKILIILIIFLPLVVSVLFHVVVLNTLTIEGKKLSSIETELAEIIRENENLKYQISKQGTISNIQKRAKELGLKPAEVSFYNPDDINIALSD